MGYLGHARMRAPRLLAGRLGHVVGHAASEEALPLDTGTSAAGAPTAATPTASANGSALAPTPSTAAPSTAAPSTAAAACDPPAPSFEELFVRYRLPLIDYICGMTRDRDWATDLAQDTFVRVYAARDALAGIANPRAWLYRNATHVTLSALRHRRRFLWLPLSWAQPAAAEAAEEDAAAAGRTAWHRLAPLELPGEDVAITVAEREAVWMVLQALPARWRAALLLQTTGGFSVGEIATLLHLSEPNVRMVLFRAKERFRRLYTQNLQGSRDSQTTRGGQV